VEAGRDLVGASMEELLDNPLAEKLLPQARVIIAEREAREAALANTILGRARHALRYIICNVAEVGGIPDLTSLKDAPFTDEYHNTKWHALLEAIEKGQKKPTLDALEEILSSALVDLLFTDLPDIESPYESVPG
jgi:hypothetical protein